MSGKRIMLLMLTGCFLYACQPAQKQAAPAAAQEPVKNCLGPRPEIMCTMQYDPVCGCDGNTYSNACMARAAGIQKSEKDPCPGNPEVVRDDLR